MVGFMVGLIHGFIGGAHDGARLGEEMLPYPRAWRAPLSSAAEKSGGRPQRYDPVWEMQMAKLVRNTAAYSGNIRG